MKKEDAIITYYKKIEKGEIVACDKIKKLYKNIIIPIVEGNDKFYEYDSKVGDVFAFFCSNYIIQNEAPFNGEPLNLLLYQRATFNALLGIRERETKRPRFTEFFFTMAKKNGKTALISAFLLFQMVRYKGINLYGIANSGEQASTIWKQIKDYIENNAEVFKEYKSRIFPSKQIYGNKNLFSALTSNARTKDGFNVHTAVFDEIHEQDMEMYGVINRGISTHLLSNNTPLIILISTAGFMRFGLYDDLYKRAENILNGKSKEKSLFPVIYEQDKEEEIYNKKMWVKSNPSIGKIKAFEYLEKEIIKGENNKDELYETMIKDFNIKIKDIEDQWLTYKELENKEFYTPPELEKIKYPRVFGGFDLSKSNDLTAFTTLFIDEKNNKKVAETMYFITEDYLEKNKNTQEKGLPWDVWLKNGYAKISGKHIINYMDVYNYIIDKAINKNYIYENIFYDPWSSNYLIHALITAGFKEDKTLIKIRQGAKTLSIPIDYMGRDIKEKRLVYQNNPITKWCLSNCVLEYDKNENKKLKKANKDRKIDGVASILNIYAGLMNKGEE